MRVTGWIGAARFSPDGRLLADRYRAPGAQVWSTATWKPVTARNFVGDASGVVTAEISRNGRTLATGTDTGVVRLWDIKTGQALGAPLPGVPSRHVAPLVHPERHTPHRQLTTPAAPTSGTSAPASLIRQACEIAGRRLTRAEWDEFLPSRDYDPACQSVPNRVPLRLTRD